MLTPVEDLGPSRYQLGGPEIHSTSFLLALTSSSYFLFLQNVTLLFAEISAPNTLSVCRIFSLALLGEEMLEKWGVNHLPNCSQLILNVGNDPLGMNILVIALTGSFEITVR